MADQISSVVAKEANEQVLLLTKQLKDLHETAQSIEIKIQAPKDIQEFVNLSAQLKTTLNNLTKATKEQAQAQLILQKAETEKQKTDRERLKLDDELMKSQMKVDAARDRERKQAEELTNDYKLLSKAYTDAANKAKNLGVTLGTTHPEFLKAATRANELRTRLQQVEGAVGQFQRQVGNYNMVGRQFNQILRELPNAGISARTFIQAISNNITGFAEEVSKARKQGDSWGSILKTMGTSMFGLVGIINLASLALTYFATNTEKSGKAIDAATQANDDYLKSLQEIDRSSAKNAFTEIARLKVLNETATNVNNSQEMRIRAAKEMRDLYPSLLNGYEQEAILNGQAANAINEVTKALLAKAKVSAAENKLSEAANREYELLLEYRRLDEELVKKQSQLKTTKDDTGVTQSLLMGDIGTLRQQIEANRQLRLQAKVEQDQFLKDAQIFATEIGNTLDKPTNVGRETIIEKTGKDATVADEQVRMLTRSIEDQLELIENSNSKRPDVKNAVMPTPVDADKAAWDKFYDYIEKKGVETAGKIFNAFADATRKKSDNEIERLDREKEFLDRNLTVEIEKIKVSEMSSKDKEKAIQQAQAETEAHRKQIESQQIESKRRAARADRDANIASIILNTAEAVIKALTDKTVPYPVRVGYAIAAGGIGATQVAIAKSTPLPQYKDGTLDHTGTLAVVGDGGEKELVVEPSGKMYMTPDKPTVMDLPKHSKVFNQGMILELSGLFTPMLMKSLESKREIHDKKLGYIIESSIDRLNNTIKKNRPVFRPTYNIGTDNYRANKTGRA